MNVMLWVNVRWNVISAVLRRDCGVSTENNVQHGCLG